MLHSHLDEEIYRDKIYDLKTLDKIMELLYNGLFYCSGIIIFYYLIKY